MSGHQTTGALVVGGDHPGLGIARSLGRRGIPVYVLDDQYSISSFSRYVRRVIRVKDLRDERKTVDSVLEAGRRFNLNRWVLFPTRDENVAAFSKNRSELSEIFRVTTPAWDSVQWAWDKANTYALAERLSIPCPTYIQSPDRKRPPGALFEAAAGHQACCEGKLLLCYRREGMAGLQP